MRKKSEAIEKKSLLSQLRDFGVGPVIGVIISMLTVPVTTRILSPEEYGKASLFVLFESIFLIVGTLGLDQGYVRFYNQRQIDRQSLFQNALFLPLCFSFLLILICVCFFKEISLFLFGTIEIGLMISFCFFIPILILNRFFLLQIRMDLRGKLYSFLNVLSQILNFVILIVFLFFYQKTFRSIVYSTIIGLFVSTFIIFLFCDKSFLREKFSFSKNIQSDLLRFSLPLVPATILSWLLNSFDKIGLRTWSDFTELGLYSAAFKIVALLNVVQRIFSTAWVPIAYKWHEENIDNQKFEDVGTVLLAVMVILFSLVIVFRDLIMLFLGTEYRGTSHIFVFLLFVPVMYTISEVTSLGINFSKKTTFQLIVVVISTLFNILGNYLLIPKFGAQGAAISTCISYILFFWGRTLFSRKVWFKFKLVKYIINNVFIILFAINMILCNNRIIEIIMFLFVLFFNGLLCLNIYRRWKK